MNGEEKMKLEKEFRGGKTSSSPWRVQDELIYTTPALRVDRMGRLESVWHKVENTDRMERMDRMEKVEEVEKVEKVA